MIEQLRKAEPAPPDPEIMYRAIFETHQRLMQAAAQCQIGQKIKAPGTPEMNFDASFLIQLETHVFFLAGQVRQMSQCVARLIEEDVKRGTPIPQEIADESRVQIPPS